MMAKSPEEHHPTEVSLVPTDRIRVLNPRVRNPKTFADMVENIAKIGLKRPITVTRRTDTDRRSMISSAAKGGSRPSFS
jgi:ParB family chromosome partitioning protein